MDTNFFKMFQEAKSHLELGMSKDIQAFFEGRNDIKNHTIEMKNEGIIFINIKLYDFSRKLSKELFLEFVGFVGYSRYNLFINENEENIDRYLYLTKSSNTSGVKMEIVIS